METCEHFRLQIPHDDANELRIDEEPCEFCEKVLKALNSPKHKRELLLRVIRNSPLSESGVVGANPAGAASLEKNSVTSGQTK